MRTIKNKKYKNITKKNIENNRVKGMNKIEETKPIIHGTIIEEKEGWIVAHIFGEPYDRGFAHGYLLKNELNKVLKTFPFIVKEQLDISLQKFINKSNKIIKPKIKKYFPEFYNELRGICDGANYGSIDISLDFLIAWNSLLSLYDVFSKKTERCSAFIACGNSTENGDIIMGHNTHSDFATGQLLNIVLYVTPSNGNSFVMQTSPGFIASSSDWFICSSGIIGCETTIGDTNYKPKFGTPYFCRIRQAMQYGKSLDDYVKIMMDKNAGDYACSWLLGDIKQNEIMLFELGLKEKHIQTTKNGVFYGMNSAIGENVRKNETNDKDYDDLFTSSGSRNARLNELLNEKYNGSINLDNSKKILSDHYDMFLKKHILNSRGICKHLELEPEPHKKTTKPFYPFGCTDSKIVNSEMASKLSFLGKMGCGCGEQFNVKKYIKEHPEYQHWGNVLADRPNRKWLKIEIL
jgi:hypothetical protein